MALSITILQPASLTATVDGASILAAVVGSSATLNVDVGVPGPAATVQVGTTTTGDAGTDAEVVNVGTLSAAILDFTIPRGDQGVQGPQGIQGIQGPQGIQGVKGDKGNTGDQGPKGDTGATGPKGDKGDTGETGAGVAPGGSAGQVLAKIDSTDYNTEWIDGGAGGGTWGSITGTLSDQTDLYDALNSKLSLSGGIISGNIQFEGYGVFFKEGTFITTELSSNKLAMYSNDSSGNNSEVGPWGIGVTNTISGQTAQLESQQIRIYNGDYTNGTSLTPNGINFNDETTQVTAYDPAVLDDYLPLAGGIMSGAIRFDNVGTQNIAKGSFDSGRGGYNGISLNCAVDYELNWQAGYLKALNSGGFTVPVNFDSSIVLSNDVFSSGVQKTISGNSIYTTSYSGYELGSDLGGYGLGGYLKIKFGNTGGDEPFENQAILSQNELRFKEAIGNTTFASYGQGGITFPDASTQNTAGLPLTGGTVNGDVTFNNIDSSHSFYSDADGFHFTGTNQIWIDGDRIYFPDNSEQSTAFPPTGGTTEQYIDGVGGLVDFPEVGDRYLTSSTSTLTINNLNGKTMTVETGLSYSTQQDIVVSHNASNHMHGTVVSYNPSTGVMVFDANQHTGSGTYSSWEVNVGGVNGAILPVAGTAGQVLAKVDGANFNTEWISLGNVALNNYATTTQTEALASTSTVISPSTLRDGLFTACVTRMNTGWVAGTTGTGGTNDGAGYDFNRLSGPTSASNTIVYRARGVNIGRNAGLSLDINWTKPVALGFRINTTSTTGTDPNSTGLITIGENTGNALALPSVRSIGIQLNYGSNIKILAHNGTSLTTFTTSTTVASLYVAAVDILLTNDPSTGTVTCYLNGTSIGSTTGGPTTQTGTNNGRTIVSNRIYNTSTPSGSQLGFITCGTISFIGN